MIVTQSTQTKKISNIILAEDDIDDQNIFQIALEEIDSAIKTQFAYNGNELLNLLQTNQPDLLFLDLEMPYKNGFQCLQILRENKAFERLPIVVFSATNRTNNIQVAYGFGANLFFIKPKDYSELVYSLKNILEMDWTDPKAITEKHFANNQYGPYSLKR